jgi:hypothetical protein
MAERRKKTKRTYQAKKKPKPSRRGTVQRSALGAEKRIYRAEILGTPPLKMVLVHAQNDRANAVMKPLSKTKTKPLSQQEVVIKIIEHLTKSQ